MTELTPSEKLEQLARVSEQTRFIIRCMRHVAGLSEVPLRFKARELIEQRLQEERSTQRDLGGVFVEERFPRPFQSFMEKRLQQLRQAKEEPPAEEEPEPRKEPEDDLKFDFSPII